MNDPIIYLSLFLGLGGVYVLIPLFMMMMMVMMEKNIISMSNIVILLDNLLATLRIAGVFVFYNFK